MRRKWYLLPAGLMIVLLVVVYRIYSSFISYNIYEESVEHLEEIYTQVSRTFATMVVKNWRLLDGWDGYIEHLQEHDSEDEIVEYISGEKEKWNFTDFYFLNEHGDYLTIEGQRGYIDLGEELSDLMSSGENIVVDGTLPGGETRTVFAVPTETHHMDGFEYSAVAISYASEDMERVINIDAFSGKSNCYVVYSDGDVLFSTRTPQEQPENVLTYLEEEGKLAAEDFEKIRSGLEKKHEGSVEYGWAGESRYLVYMPVGFQDWMLIGTVPKNVVSRRLTRVQLITTALLVAVFAVFIILSFMIMIRRNRRRLDEKSLDIKYREQLFGILANSVDNIFVMFSGEGYQVEYVSPNIEKILGISVKELKTDIRKLGELYTHSGESVPLTKRSELDAIELGGCWQHETELVHHRTNESHWYSETLYRVPVSGNEKFILVLTDRTEEKKQKQTLQQALEMAESANEAKSDFLCNMSHDIRTPMNAIVGYAMLLGKDADKEDRVREYTKKIAASSQHLLGLINDILDMSKIESGNTKLNQMEFSVSEVLEELKAVIMPQAEAKGQSFEVRAFAMKHDYLLGDRMRFSQILINLLSNAVKYTPDSGSIELIIENLCPESERYARLRIQVRDNGIGMSSEFLETIYDPFSRARNSTVSKIQGTGLGMAITKNLVNLMGGTISVESTPGKGSVFTVNITFCIPRQEQDEDFWRRHGIFKVLAVDDEEEICRNIYELMRDTGVEVSYTTEGQSAVQMVSAAHETGEDYSLILLDWKMPDVDGVEVAGRIRECVGSDISILVLTAYDWGDIEEEAREAGIDAFLAKPFFVSGLRHTIEQLWEREGITGEAETMEPEAAVETSLRGLHILVAEDNEINSELLTELLEMEGATCEVAVNGREALELFEHSEPGSFDIILMDIQMPEMDGYEATRAIRACAHPEAATIPIAAMTANAFAEDVEKALASGMNVHVAKPIDMKVLKAAIARLLKKE